MPPCLKELVRRREGFSRRVIIVPRPGVCVRIQNNTAVQALPPSVGRGEGGRVLAAPPGSYGGRVVCPPPLTSNDPSLTLSTLSTLYPSSLSLSSLQHTPAKLTSNHTPTHSSPRTPRPHEHQHHHHHPPPPRLAPPSSPPPNTHTPCTMAGPHYDLYVAAVAWPRSLSQLPQTTRSPLTASSSSCSSATRVRPPSLTTTYVDAH